jgi:hypothetical protein
MSRKKHRASKPNPDYNPPPDMVDLHRVDWQKFLYVIIDYIACPSDFLPYPASSMPALSPQLIGGCLAQWVMNFLHDAALKQRRQKRRAAAKATALAGTNPPDEDTST